MRERITGKDILRNTHLKTDLKNPACVSQIYSFVCTFVWPFPLRPGPTGRATWKIELITKPGVYNVRLSKILYQRRTYIQSYKGINE